MAGRPSKNTGMPSTCTSLRPHSRHYADIEASGNAGCNGYGAEKVAALFNKGLMSPGDRKISKADLTKAMREGTMGKTPPQRGRPLKVPLAVTDALALQTQMIQVLAAGGEATRQTMIATLMAMAHNTVHKDKYSHEYAV